MRIAVAAILIAVHSFALPAVASPILTLEQAIQKSLNESWLVAGINRSTELKKADATELEALPNPELQVDTTVLERNSAEDINAELTQPLKPSDFGARQSLAAAMRNLAGQEEQTELLELIHNITARYVELWIVQEHIRLLNDNLSFATRTSKLLRSAAQRGELDVAQSYLFDAETIRLEEEVKELKTRQVALSSLLSRDLRMEVAIVEVAAPSLAPIPSEETVQQIASSSASPRSLLLARERLLDQRMEIAEQDSRFPLIAPRLLYNEGFGNESRAAGIGVILRIPLWDEYKAEKERIEAERSFITASLQNFDSVGSVTLLNAHHSKARDAAERAEIYRSRIIPAYEKSLKATRRMMEAGQASSLQLWEVHERLHDAEEKALDVLREAFQSRAELEILLGQPLENPL